MLATDIPYNLRKGHMHNLVRSQVRQCPDIITVAPPFARRHLVGIAGHLLCNGHRLIDDLQLIFLEMLEFLHVTHLYRHITDL